MEQYIPIIIAVIAFAYKAYSNFQKEQEKARKRNPRQQAAAPESRPSETVYDKYPEPVLQTPVEKTDYQPQALTPEYGSFTGFLSEEELARKKRKEKQLAEKSRKSAIALDKLKNDALEETPAFDLRDAVIKAAILERPYR